MNKATDDEKYSGVVREHQPARHMDWHVASKNNTTFMKLCVDHNVTHIRRQTMSTTISE